MTRMSMGSTNKWAQNGGYMYFRGYLHWMFIILAWTSSVPSYGKTQYSPEPSNCRDLILQLQAMNSAQRSLLTSMIQKNDAISDSLNDYADEFAMKGNRVSKLDLKSLHNSADSFQRHKEREKSLVDKFQNSSHDLIDRVSVCLVRADQVLRSSQNQ